MKQYDFNHKQKHYVILVGQNKQDNFDIIDMSKETDIWFHIKDVPSCHVILQTDEKENMSNISRQVIKKCGNLCKMNSKIHHKCEIIYTTISNITKTNILGQVIVNNNSKKIYI